MMILGYSSYQFCPGQFEDQQAKSLITMFNRWLRNAVEKISAWFPRIRFLPAQLKFIDRNGVRRELFNQDDGLTLNELGAKVLKDTLFQLAGFVKNV